MHYKDTSSHEAKNQRTIATRTSQTIKYGHDVITQRFTDV